MPATNVNALAPFVDRSHASTIKVEAKAERESTSLFGELVDTVNPLQHVPGVSQAYRAITKDKISNGAKFAGHVGLGAAVAGPVGAAVGVGVYLIEGLFGALFGGGRKGGEKLVKAENVTSGPTVLAGNQAVHAGKMRGNAAIGNGAGTLPARAAAAPTQIAAVPAAQTAQKTKSTAPAAPSLGTAPVEMSSAQFAALLGAFGASAPAAAPAASDRDDNRNRANTRTQGVTAPDNADFAARMAANLDKLDALRRSQGQAQ